VSVTGSAVVCACARGCLTSSITGLCYSCSLSFPFSLVFLHPSWPAILLTRMHSTAQPCFLLPKTRWKNRYAQVHLARTSSFVCTGSLFLPLSCIIIRLHMNAPDAFTQLKHANELCQLLKAFEREKESKDERARLVESLESTKTKLQMFLDLKETWDQVRSIYGEQDVVIHTCRKACMH
jgi:hypothetical protein